MSIFDVNPGPQTASVQVPPAIIRVSRATGNGNDPPTYSDFVDEPRLAVNSIFRGSSIAGQSYADVRLVSGLPVTPQIDVENAGTVLKPGDRVVIGLADNRQSEGVRWLFGGYCTKSRTTIGPREQCSFRLVGPEWLWGSGGGAGRVVSGQLRRGPEADDLYFSPVDISTDREELELFTDVATVFNPNGLANAAIEPAYLTLRGVKPQETGQIFEEPNRMREGQPACVFWLKYFALKFLVLHYNDPLLTGIAAPEWGTIPLSLDGQLRNISVEGLGLWDALKKVLEPEYAFFVTSNPTRVYGNTWEGFQVNFFARSQDVGGTEANLWLNKRGTPLDQAQACVTRLDVARDISKTVNRCVVLGKRTIQVKLIYHGGKTPTLSDAFKKTALQHGWTKSEGNLADYAASGPDGAEVSYTTVQSKSVELQNRWQDRYTSSGKEYASNRHIFRLLTWNECNELVISGKADEKPGYGPTPTLKDWWPPDLKDIADSPFHPGSYCRRRRPLLDTLYRPSKQDDYTKIRPTLFMAVVANATDDLPSTGWKRIPESQWNLDPVRSAIYFTAADLSDWEPFKEKEERDGDTLEAKEELRSFATLLHLGVLRMILEGSVETDWALRATAQRVNDSGSPFVREVIVRADRDFLQTTRYVDGVPSPSGLTPKHIDFSGDAQRMANQMRAAGQDAQISASVSVAADYPEQGIGKIIKKIKGRNIDLSSAGDRGAQIVAASMDFSSFKWELLTTSAALEMRDLHSKQFSHRKGKMGRYRQGDVQ